MCKTATARCSWSKRYARCSRGCATSSLIAPMPAQSFKLPLPNSASGRSRSSSDRKTLLASNSCHAAGLSSVPSPGSTATAALPRISRRQSPVPRLGSSWPPFASSLGEWYVYNTTFTIPGRTLRGRSCTCPKDSVFQKQLKRYREVHRQPNATLKPIPPACALPLASLLVAGHDHMAYERRHSLRVIEEENPLDHARYFELLDDPFVLDRDVRLVLERGA